MTLLLRASALQALVILSIGCGGDGGDDRFLGRVDVTTGVDVGFSLDGTVPPADVTGDPGPDPGAEPGAEPGPEPGPEAIVETAADTMEAGDAPEATDTPGDDVPNVDPPSLVVTPNPLDFGPVSSEGFAQRELTLRNAGAADLTVLAWQVLAGGPEFLLHGATMDGQEPPLTLEPDATAVLTVAFQPGALPAGPTSGTIRIDSDDPQAPHTDVPLKAKVVTSTVCTLLPDEAGLAFGDVQVGCGQALRTASFSNPCVDAVQVTKVRVKGGGGCGLAYAVLGAPDGPVSVPPGGHLEVQVRYRPLEPGPAPCTLALATSLATADPEMGLSGNGLAGPMLVTDTFHQIPGHKADVLFVVDASGSMMAHVEALADDVGALTEAFTAHGTDFHLGAVGISASDSCATPGQLLGEPSFLTASTGQGLHDLVLGALDDDCANSGTEAGLAAAALALSPALTAETSTPCTFGFACGPGLVCVDGLCGGPNRGFLRADAALHVLVLSDEDDQSPGTVASYVNGFRSIKGPANPDLFRFHAIVGKAGATGCPDGSFVQPGTRYLEVAAATGGKIRDVCTDDYAGLLAEIGDVGVAFKTAWTLSQPADPDGLVVSIEGQACGEGYSYSGATQQVIVEADGPCLPGPGETLSVTYATACGAP